MDHFSLVRPMDGFGEGMVVGVPHAAHCGFDPRSGQTLGMADRHVLRSPITVVNQAVGAERPPGIQRLLQRIQYEVGPGRAGRLPADERASEDIDHDGYVDEALPVETSVKSATHNAFGRSAVNWRLTRSWGREAPRSPSVVLTTRPWRTPCRPRCRISRSTVQRATSTPSRRSCRQTWSAPYPWKVSSQTRRISPPSRSSRRSRADRRPGSAGRAACSRYVDGAIGGTLPIGSTP